MASDECCCYSLSEDSIRSDLARGYIAGDDIMAFTRLRTASIDLGFALGNSITVTMDLKAEFRVSLMEERASQ